MTASSDNLFPSLSSEQDQRVWALIEAWKILRSGWPLTANEVSVIDLIDLAGYIMTGVDPYDHRTMQGQIDESTA